MKRGCISSLINCSEGGVVFDSVETNQFIDSLNLLSMLAIKRRIEIQTENYLPLSFDISRISTLYNNSLYKKAPTNHFPPGALPENSIVWAKVVSSMPKRMNTKQEEIPWHLARIIYTKPLEGYTLNFVKKRGEPESINEFLIEWMYSCSKTLNHIHKKGSPMTKVKTQLCLDNNSPTQSVHVNDSYTLTQNQSPSSGLNNQKYKLTINPIKDLGLCEYSKNNELEIYSPGSEPENFFSVNHNDTISNKLSPKKKSNQKSISIPICNNNKIVFENLNRVSVDMSTFTVACSPWHFQYYIHYQGYNRRYDRWVTLDELLPSIVHPITLRVSRQSIAKHFISAIQSFIHPLWFDSSNANYPNNSKANMSLNLKYELHSNLFDKSELVDDYLIDIVITTLKLICSIFHQSNINSGLLRYRKKLRSTIDKQDIDMMSSSNPIPFLEWCLKFFTESENITNSQQSNCSTAHEITKIWWMLIFLAYFQMDALNTHGTLQYITRRKRKSISNIVSSWNHIWKICPSKDIIDGLKGKNGMNFKSLSQDLNTANTLLNQIFYYQNFYLSYNQLKDCIKKKKDISNKDMCLQLIYLEGNNIIDSKTPLSILSEKKKDSSTIANVKTLLNQILVAAIMRSTESNKDNKKKISIHKFNLEKNIITLNFFPNYTGIDDFNNIMSDVGEHGDMDSLSIEAHEVSTKLRTINNISINDLVVSTWYYSPFPIQYQYLDCLYICGGCLEYFSVKEELQHHELICTRLIPPGHEIYCDGNLSFFEIDGELYWQFCENLSLISKLFLDHKTLHYSVTPFLFYVLVQWLKTNSNTNKNNIIGDSSNSRLLRMNQIVGYFSKEKASSMGYNLACILTFPQYQRKGYGRFLMDFSYVLSKIEQKPGTPERPLSDLGRISYMQYWKSTLSNLLLTYIDALPLCMCQYKQLFTSDYKEMKPHPCKILDKLNKKKLFHQKSSLMCFGELDVTLEDLEHFTCICYDDILTTLTLIDCISKTNSPQNEYKIIFHEKKLRANQGLSGKSVRTISPKYFLTKINLKTSGTILWQFNELYFVAE